jgi:hypothetical protein
MASAAQRNAPEFFVVTRSSGHWFTNNASLKHDVDIGLYAARIPAYAVRDFNNFNNMDEGQLRKENVDINFDVPAEIPEDCTTIMQGLAHGMVYAARLMLAAANGVNFATSHHSLSWKTLEMHWTSKTMFYVEVPDGFKTLDICKLSFGRVKTSTFCPVVKNKRAFVKLSQPAVSKPSKCEFGFFPRKSFSSHLRLISALNTAVTDGKKLKQLINEADKHVGYAGFGKTTKITQCYKKANTMFVGQTRACVNVLRSKLKGETPKNMKVSTVEAAYFNKKNHE